jgi:CheY-like chemotaxis protein
MRRFGAPGSVFGPEFAMFRAMAIQSTNGTTIISRIPPKKILLVDDVPDLAQAMEMMLTKLGHTVVVSSDGKDAVARFTPEAFDLVITDYSMPRMNGVELAEILKRRSPGQRILMVTAYTFTIAAYDGRPLPVDAILRKPFHPREFNDTLAELFSPKQVQAKPVQQSANPA